VKSGGMFPLLILLSSLEFNSPSTAPACGFYAFEYDAQNTFYNFGCSRTSYSFIAVLASTSTSSSKVVLPGGGTTVITLAPTVTVTQLPPSFPPTASTTPTTAADSGTSTSDGNPTINTHVNQKKPPIGAIIGGALGGLALAIAASVLAWCCIRRNRRKALDSAAKPQLQQNHADAATAAAFHNHQNQNRISELGGMPKPPTDFRVSGAGQIEKPGLNSTTQEFYKPTPSTIGSELSTERISTQSPPPQYTTPLTPTPSSPLLSTYPPSTFTELESGRHSVRPISEAPGTGTFSSMNTVPSELADPRIPNQAGYMAYQPNQNHDGAQEMQGSKYVAYPPNQAHVGAQEMSGTATGGVAQSRKPARVRGVDMSGAPLRDDWNSHE
jgi:hypothetical protein